MLSESTEEKLVQILVERMQKVNESIIKKIASNLDEIGKLTPSKAQQLAQILKYGGSYNQIVKELQRLTKLNANDINKIFDELAKRDLNFAKDFYKYRNIDFIPYEQNTALKSQVEAIKRRTMGTFINFSNTNAIGYSIKGLDNKLKFYNLPTIYQKLIDEGVLAISQGKTNFNDYLYQTIKNIGNSGLKMVDYASGRSMRLDSAIRMNLREGLRDLHNTTQQIIGEQFGSDGVEISVHEYPAIDHELVQGKQFSNAQYDMLNSGMLAVDYKGNSYTLDHDHKNGYRPIGTLNCYHSIFSIVLGVSKPRYTDKQLKQIRDTNNKGFMFEDKHYTMYEGTQLQRNIETEIRKQKDIQIMAKEVNNEQLIQESQLKINRLNQKYKELSNVSGLREQNIRKRVSGYKRKGIK